MQSVEFVLSRTFEGQEPPFNCYDNAVSTLGKLIYFQGQQATLGSAVPLFLSKLPLTTDSTEAQAVHLLFLQQIQAQNANLMSGDKAEIQNAVLRIAQKDKDQPGLEILCD